MSALYAVTIEVAPDVESAWRQWMEGAHVLEVLREPGFLGCRLWKDTASPADGWARYVSQYELTGLEAVERYVASDAAKRLRADGLTRFGEAMRISRAVLTEVAHFV